ncbi:MAG: hypothetical protein IJD50_05745 [Clostridia bacterium]|nr:hypothetical protein [Clostridia bacterium]
MVNREDRAKQFMPFDALKGLQEELRKREERRLRQNKRELCDEEIESLTKALNSLKRGMRVQITYYNFITERYVTTIDVFTKLYRETRFIKTENNNISFDDLLDIKILNI